jgi:diguanylate cyclase (GGDEF)-like protein
LTAQEENSNLPWISGEFDITALLRSASRLLTREQFLDHADRQLEITRKSLDWRFALFMVNVDSLEQLTASRGSQVADEFLRNAAERVGKRLNPRDAVALMRDRCFAILVEVPLLKSSMDEFAASVQAEILTLAVEQNARIDSTASVGIAKVRGNYAAASDAIRDAGLALKHAREAGAGTVMVFNRAMELADSAIAT